MSAVKHVYQIELSEMMPPEKAAIVAVERLRQDGRQAEVSKRGFAPAVKVDGALYLLTVATAAGSGIGVPCVVLREQ